MKSAIWVVLFVLGLTGVLVPSSCLYVASQLPRLENEFDLKGELLRSARTSQAGGTIDLAASASALEPPNPDFGRLPRDLIALYLSQLGCPAFFSTHREDGPRWAWRLIGASMGLRQEGDGACELRLAARVAAAMGITGSLRRLVAAHRIHALLRKDQLLAYDLASARFDAMGVGVEAEARALFKKEIDALDLSEMAELVIALPPSELYDEMKSCRNAGLIRQNRDYLLARVARDALIDYEPTHQAQMQPASCTRN